MQTESQKNLEDAQEKLTAEIRGAAESAESLINSTGEQLEEKTKEIRERLAAALEIAKATYEKVEEQAIAGAKATDQAIRTHPYPAIGIAFGAGLLLGFLIKRK